MVHVYKGDKVKLPCHVTPTTATNVTWLQRVRPRSRFYDIYINDEIYQRLRHRFSIYNSTVGDYSLNISEIWPPDAGHYLCFNQQQLIKEYFVNVSGSY